MSVDREKACRQIVETFIRLANKYESLEKIPVRYGSVENLYHSERHLLDHIGDNPDLNVTELARLIGVTKGAVSQVIKKIEQKGLIERRKKVNNKEVQVGLSEAGWEIYRQHQEVNQRTNELLRKKLRSYSDDKIHFLLEIFDWIESYLDHSKQEMEKKHRH